MKIDFSRYSPQELRDQTEIEFQKCGDAKQAVYNALAFLNNMYGVSDMKKTISLDTQLYKQNDYSKESILKEENDFMKHFNSNDMQKATQLEIGTKIESEHKDTFKFIKDYRKKHGEYPPEEMVYKQIAKDHLSEFKDYYTRLIAMEKQAEQEMSKAKYIKKIPDGKGGWKYFYAEPKDKKERNIEEKKNNKKESLEEWAYVANAQIKISDKDFIKCKQRHLIKIEISKFLDNHPFILLPLYRISLFFRDNKIIDIKE